PIPLYRGITPRRSQEPMGLEEPQEMDLDNRILESNEVLSLDPNTAVFTPRLKETNDQREARKELYIQRRIFKWWDKSGNDRVKASEVFERNERELDNKWLTAQRRALMEIQRQIREQLAQQQREARLQQEREERERRAQQEREERERRAQQEREEQERLELQQREEIERRRQELVRQAQQRREERERLRRELERRRQREQRTREKQIQRRRMRRYITGDVEACAQNLHEDAHKALDATHTPVRQPIPIIPDGIAQDVDGLALKQPTLRQIQFARDRLNGMQRIAFYSDGSVTNIGSEQVSAAFGVVVMTERGSFEPAISGRVAGYATSALAELCGLLATLLISPRNTPVDVYIDNSSVVHNFKTLVKERKSTTAKQRLRSADAQWWAMLYYAYETQGRMVNVQWVRGHAGNLGNIAADSLAKAAHRSDTGLWRLDQQRHHDMRCHAQFAKHTVDQDVRQVLKLQSAVRHHRRWLSQNRTREYIRDCDSISWTPTLRIVHNNNPPKTGYTSLTDCGLRAHRIKKLHGMLPTLDQMRQRNPGLYITDSCQRCDSGEVETDHHLWNCGVSMEDQQYEWGEIAGKVVTFGKRAWRHAMRKWQQEKTKAEKANKEFVARCPTFTERDEREVWTSLEWISGVGERHRRYMDTRSETEDAVEVWTVKDLYRGLVPVRLIDTWKQLFETTSFIATYMATVFVAEIEEFGRTGIWNKRCEETVAWEKSVGITTMSKRARGRTGDEGHPRSGGDFSDLTRRRANAPNETDVKRAADERVCQHFLGRVKLGMMERLHGLKTNLLTLDLDQ
ncbi:hypothetical protein BGX21_003280, partial [Mortierella sp. AD011]